MCSIISEMLNNEFTIRKELEMILQINCMHSLIIVCKQAKNVTACIDSPMSQNLMTWTFSCGKRGNISRDDLKVAKAVLASFDHIFFLGETQAMNDLFLSLGEAPPPHQHAIRKGRSTVPISETNQEHFREHNKFDLELYDFARMLVRKRVERVSVLHNNTRP